MDDRSHLVVDRAAEGFPVALRYRLHTGYGAFGLFDLFLAFALELLTLLHEIGEEFSALLLGHGDRTEAG